ncbi:hypothetical protein FM037_24555 [Shewanella psychropiezotolerans]|uniref:Uncharacterized protein n=1 Tax=Shewanella psychropiezotolerans TaxID=2593655 RepID=A0ABX5X9A7_9GAMM|nr:hypothetical protein [Shewanella psychropiezotolerans]QDO85851.1 hypothetical protein FM037_24555 [Shewanella psychropiezotolerans]
MKKLMMLMLASFTALASVPVCYDGYCQYHGKVSRIYVNSVNLILLYFDTAMDPGEGSTASMSLTTGAAAAVKMSDNPEFAKLFYSTALAAQACQRNVQIQMRGTISGYMKIDRIWLSE